MFPTEEQVDEAVDEVLEGVDYRMFSPEKWKQIRNYLRYGIKGSAQVAKVAAPVAGYFYPDWAAHMNIGAHMLDQVAKQLTIEELMALQNLQMAHNSNNLGGLY